MRLKQLLGTLLPLVLLVGTSAAAVPQLTAIRVHTQGTATTVAIQASGAFTHTEYRPAENLLLVDLAGISAGKLEGRAEKLPGAGLLSYHVLGYKGVGDSPMTRIELGLVSHATVEVSESQGALLLRLNAPATTQAATPAPAKTAHPAGRPLRVRQVAVGRGRDSMDIEIRATGPISPKAMRLTSPDRIVVDVPNALPSGRVRQIVVNAGDVKTVRVAPYQLHPPTTRIVVDLTRAREYQLAVSGSQATLKLHTPTLAAMAAASAGPAASAPAPPLAPATPVAAARQEVAQPAPATRADQAAGNFAAQKLDAPFSNGPIVPAANAALQPQPAVNLAMMQAARPAAAPAAPAVSGCATGRYTGEPISVNLKDVDLKDFFRLIHEISGLNIVLDPNVKGSLTIVLDDVPWDQALAIVLKNNTLDCELEGNVLRIATIDTLRKEADAKRAQMEAQSLAVGKVTVTRYLSYAHSKDVATTVKKFLTQRGDVTSDDRTNALIIEDIPAVIPTVDRLLKELDQKTQEVEIEARVVAATRNFSRDIGTQLGFAWGNGKAFAIGGASGAGVSPLTVTPPQVVVTDPITGMRSLAPATPAFFTTGNAIPLFSNLPAVGPNSGISLSNFTQNYRLDFILTLAETRGLLKILSRPRVVTQNNIRASMRQGVRIPVVTAAQLGGPPTTTYVDAFLRLEVTPQITAEGTIFLDVNVENTTPDFARQVAGNPTLLTQQATTQVLVTDGGTLVLGGVIQTTNSVTVDQVPLLGDIPLLGNLFKRRFVSTSTLELIFFITPKIIQT